MSLGSQSCIWEVSLQVFYFSFTVESLFLVCLKVLLVKEKAFFLKNCLGALVVFSFNVSLKTVSLIRWFVKTKDLTQQREIELCLKQTAPALSLCSCVCKNRDLVT